MYIVVIHALVEHPVNQPHRKVDVFPLHRGNENTTIVPPPGYVISAVLLVDDEQAQKYLPMRPNTAPQQVIVPPPENPSDPEQQYAMQYGQRRWR